MLQTADIHNPAAHWRAQKSGPIAVSVCIGIHLPTKNGILNRSVIRFSHQIQIMNHKPFIQSGQVLFCPVFFSCRLVQNQIFNEAFSQTVVKPTPLRSGPEGGCRGRLCRSYFCAYISNYPLPLSDDWE